MKSKKTMNILIYFLGIWITFWNIVILIGMVWLAIKEHIADGLLYINAIYTVIVSSVLYYFIYHYFMHSIVNQVKIEKDNIIFQTNRKAYCTSPKNILNIKQSNLVKNNCIVTARIGKRKRKFRIKIFVRGQKNLIKNPDLKKIENLIK